jgi:AraC family transcriptional regulator of adaptative response / DNA-3-methyladenine glycosylase II
VRLPPLEIAPPYARGATLGFLALRAVAGVEEVVGDRYRRVVRAGGRTGVLEARFTAGAIELELDDALADAAGELAAASARAFASALDGAAADAVLGADPLLAAQVGALPGVRMPGSVDGFEVAVRAVLGQQVSLAAGLTHASRLAARMGEALPAPSGGLRVAFPAPEAVAGLRQGDVGVPRARLATLVALGEAVAGGRVELGPGADPAATRAALVALPGIGPWTADYVVMRALGDPDVFLDSDLVLRRVLGAGEAIGAREAGRRAVRYAPYRSLAVARLWLLSATGG